jgi:crotonobetainyl-CoA:carnitine CoA-transferase CaiB-like acyl-CoA transferase
VPYVMAACVAAALAQRRMQGRGCHIDASMYEICVQQMQAAIIAAQRGATPRRMGNADPGVFSQEVYPSRGEDRWVAISVFDENEQARLAALAGGRPIAEWTRSHEDHALVAQLQAEGIAAGVLQDVEDLLERDPQLRARGALVDLPHPRLGTFGHMRTPISFSADRVMPYRAPGIGEHSREIALDVAGVSTERYAELEAAGVLK